MADYLLLYYEPGAAAWKQLPLTGPSFSLGRAPENNLVLDDAQVSRQHALLRFDARGVWIMDQNSSNGVSLGGRRIAAGTWQSLPPGTDFTIGGTMLRVEAVRMAAAQTARPRKRGSLALPLTGALILGICACVAVGGAAWMFLPRLLSPAPTAVTQPPGVTVTSPLVTGTPAALALEPPQVIDNLPASAGGGPVQDDQGVSLAVPSDVLEGDQLAYLERARLSPSMQAEIEKTYQVESLAYAVRLQDGQDGVGQVALALPARSPESRLAVLVDDRWLGILETPAQDGAFRIGLSPNLGAGLETYDAQGGGGAQAPNRYLVLTPKAGGSQTPSGGVRLASFAAQADPDGQSCITEFWAVNHCWRNPEGSVYIFWENDFPASLKDQEYLRVVDTVKAVAALMKGFEDNGFTAAAISPSNPAYVIIEAGASEPYYSFKTGNVYIPWDIIGGIGDSQNRCTLAHEFFHWIEDEEYRMGVAALSGPKSWWLETSAENGAFLLDSGCLEKNLTQYGLVNTSGNVLGFQAAPLQWESGEQARYIHSLQLYLSICEGGANCALSQEAWVQAINSGTYPLEGSALAAYEKNAKDLGRFLLGAAPLESRGVAVIPPSAVSGSRFGDYLVLRTSPRGIWDFGLTMSQFNKASEQQVKVEAKIAQGGVYPLWVSNGTGTPMGGGGGNTGLPGLLEIQAGPAFWLKPDQAEPVFYAAGTSLKLGPISDKLGIGAARIVAVAPDGDQTFQASLSLADLSGDWSASVEGPKVTVEDCPAYSPDDDDDEAAEPDPLLQYFSAYGTYARNAADPASLNLTWEGVIPEEGLIASSEVTVEADKVTLHYRVDIPQSADSGGALAGALLGRGLTSRPAPQHSQWFTLWPALPVLGVAAWTQRRRARRARLALVALLVLAAFGLSGCISFAGWGSIDVTYTFDKLEYVDPQPAAASGAEAQPDVTWRLLHGDVQAVYDLTFEIETTDSEGKEVTEIQRCNLTISGSATGTIGPEGSVTPPDAPNQFR